MPSFSSLKSAFMVESTLSSSCSRFDLHQSCQGVALAHLDSLLRGLVLWTDGSVSFLFGKDGFGVLANCSLFGTDATLSFSAGPVCSSFSAVACAILHALCWTRLHQQVCHFSSLLLLSDSYAVLATLLSSTFLFTSNSVADLAETVFSFLLFYEVHSISFQTFLVWTLLLTVHTKKL